MLLCAVHVKSFYYRGRADFPGLRDHGFQKAGGFPGSYCEYAVSLNSFADQCVLLFCNLKRNGIKVLRYDSNGFILASKKLLDGMKFQWPKTPEGVK
ncbi:hypothetical protein ADH76_06775 [Enterocloster clostridioformis]|nr:hypothetical protein A4V08_32950 [Lachnoclostridium sp. YL32]NDO28592.1 transposase [Enterocloster clostridioformis]OXE71023.1 hypothetical protein ADH76_06775 [Enterocloster clostridioformis]QQR01175.1 IS66 family insertion sequence element accessory protein TnpB [Enterocloster clostridioformis]